MNFKSFMRWLGLCSFLLVTGSTLLTGCARSSFLVRTPAALDSSRTQTQPARLIQDSPAIVPPTTTPTLIGLPEAGGPQPTLATSSPTPLPAEPTATSTPEPTAIPTQAPTTTPAPVAVAAAPVPAQHYAPSRIVIPAINLDASIVAVGWTVTIQNGERVSEWIVPGERLVGWLNTSAPVGVSGNTVLVGHQNVDGRVFENLEYLQPGNEIQLQAGNELRRYAIATRLIVPEKDQPLEVRLENARWIGRSADERVTLITCWPHNDNTHRLILVALPIP